MIDEPRRAPVRVRTRVRTEGGEQRLVADTAPEKHQTRKPNSGSMKPGETRNPNGRPKGAKGTKALVRKVLSTKTTIRDGGTTRKVSLYYALLLKEVQLAVNGDWRARKTVLELGRWALPEEDPSKSSSAASGPARDAADIAILEWFESEIRAKSAVENDHDD